jgi:hypothetical protein
MTPAPTTAELRAVALEMQDIDRRIGKLVLMEAQLRALDGADGVLAAIQCRQAVQVLKIRWGTLADMLTGGEFMNAKDVRALVTRLEAEQRAAFDATP